MRPERKLRQPMRQSLGIDENKILIGNISGLREIKGVRLFVDAAIEACRRNPLLIFMLVGEGELRSELEEKIHGQRLEKSIRLMGAAEDVRPYLAAFDIAVLCSHAEGFSNSLLEYMASGVPVIATDVGGNREALGDCGLLIRPKTGELVDAIQAMSCTQVRSRFAETALQRVKSFDVSVANERMHELYAEYMERKGPNKRSNAQMVAHPQDSF
jgi:glycosyltransferase involved in cell wall biosynthesis